MTDVQTTASSEPGSGIHARSCATGATASTQYVEAIVELIERLHSGQRGQIDHAAQLVSASLATGGVLHIFGSGHSQMAAHEIYLRAGGLAAVNAILDANLSFYGSVNSDRLERLEGYAEVLLREQDLRSGEAVIVVSNSGVNPVHIEVAQIARSRGRTVVVVTSVAEYSSDVRLADLADVVIDTGTPYGDAVVAVAGQSQHVGAASSVLASIVVLSIVVEALAIGSAHGNNFAVFASANLPGGDERNQISASVLRDRLPNIRI